MAVYTSADWHACADPALKILEYLKSDDTLYFLGDSCDRGPDGILLFEKMVEDPRVKMIKGNHDFFIESCVPLLLADEDSALRNSYIDSWLYGNGGRRTWEAFRDLDPAKRDKYLDIIRKMPVEIRYSSPLGHQVILEHAGYTPGMQYRSHDPLWDREHFYDKWNKEFKNTYIVHGHTPVQYLKHMYGYEGQPQKTKEDILERKLWFEKTKTLAPPAIIRYCGGHKFCIDLCTIASGRVALLNLDTFEEIYFDEGE